MLEDLKLEAKKLGIKSVHLYKSEEKLQAKIDEFLLADKPKVEKPKYNFRNEVDKAEEKLNKEPDGEFAYMVTGKSLRIGNFKYFKGETFNSKKPNLDKHHGVVKV